MPFTYAIALYCIALLPLPLAFLAFRFVARMAARGMRKAAHYTFFNYIK
jgi:hypothetical protein